MQDKRPRTGAGRTERILTLCERASEIHKGCDLCRDVGFELMNCGEHLHILQMLKLLVLIFVSVALIAELIIF